MLLTLPPEFYVVSAVCVMPPNLAAPHVLIWFLFISEFDFSSIKDLKIDVYQCFY